MSAITLPPTLTPKYPRPLPIPGPRRNGYQTHLTFGPTDQASRLAAPRASVLVSDLLP